MIRMGEESSVDFFGINGRQVKESDACVLIGVAGRRGWGQTATGAGMPPAQGWQKW